MTILNFKIRRPERLRDKPFTSTFDSFGDIKELTDAYKQEILETVNDFHKGEVTNQTLNTCISRAIYAAYKRGLQDGKTIARNERISVFRRKKRPLDYIDKL